MACTHFACKSHSFRLKMAAILIDKMSLMGFAQPRSPKALSGYRGLHRRPSGEQPTVVPISRLRHPLNHLGLAGPSEHGPAT